MKITTKYQEFFLYCNDGKLIVQFSRGFPYNGFAARFQLGAGAGCRNGATVFLAFNSGSLYWRRAFRAGRNVNGQPEGWLTRSSGIEAGITRNANIVPHMSH